MVSASTVFLILSVLAAGQEPRSNEAVRLLPRTVGAFRAEKVREVTPTDEADSGEPGVRAGAAGVYMSPAGERLSVVVISTQSHGVAYSLLSRFAAKMRSEARSETTKPRDIGVAAVAIQNRLAFYKGSIFVAIKRQAEISGNGEDPAVTFAREYAGTLPEAENEIPVLVKHLPDWETAQHRAIYVVSSEGLRKAVGDEAVLDAVSFENGSEAVTANYDASRLLIVEFTTPQVAEINDERIRERIETLRRNGESVPSAYRRVGNYSVLVFNAPDESTASQLIDKVKYEQRIQWLSQNPFAFEEAEKQYTQKAVSLILGIAKAIGFFVALCLGAGGIVGGIAYLHRRTQQRAAAESYSDAGGMLRLNLDDMTSETDPARLLASGDGENAIRP